MTKHTLPISMEETVRRRVSHAEIPEGLTEGEGIDNRTERYNIPRENRWCTPKRLVITIIFVLAIVLMVAGITIVVLRRAPEPESKDQLECVASLDNETICTKAGCVWKPSSNPDNPSCLLPKNSPFGFYLDEYEVDTETLKLRLAKGSFFGDDFKNPRLKITEYGDNIIRVQFLDEGEQRYQVPIEYLMDPMLTSLETRVYDVELDSDPEKLFSFKVLRARDRTVIFDSSVGSLFLADHHIEVTTKLPSRNVYGLGESTHKTFRHDLNSFNKWPLFSRNKAPDPWEGAGRYNLYGVHPYYMCLEDSGKAHGVLFLNSNAMEFTLTPMPALNFRSSGGILDMTFFLGDNPEHVTQLYTQVIGRPLIPPYWGLGFQLCRYGYNSLNNMSTAINRTRDNGFPLDVFYADIDVMNERRDFTWNNETFPNFNEFVEQEKSQNGLHFITIVDPGIIANDSSYKPYQEGLENDVYVKWPANIPQAARNNPPDPGINLTMGIMFGKVWPKGPVAFPDFFKNSTKSWWTKTLSDFRKMVNFDGIWIDMNEPTNFETDKDKPNYCPSNDKKCWSLKCPVNEFDNPNNTFVPSATAVYTPKVKLSDKTLCMAAVQGDKGQYVHYDVHSLYGWSETEPTYRALMASAEADQAPMIISRSTYPSSGRFGTHWLGDNLSTWNSMRSSIVGMLEFNLFGIPFIGADICGFHNNSESELCGRWMQLGAFYPFSRNHNMKKCIDQDPGSPLLSERDRNRARTAMITRYQLLPYLHTLHYLARVNGNTVVRALFHEFPRDKNTYDNQEQFMWGESLLISPVLYESATTVDVYLPDTEWYDFYQGTAVLPTSADRKIKIHDTEIVPLHVKAGSILAIKERGANNTKQSRQKNFEIHVYPTSGGTAKGDLFWTAENVTDVLNDFSFRFFHFEFNQTKLIIQLTSKESFQYSNKQMIGKIVFYGQSKEPAKVRYQDQEVNSTETFYNSSAKAFTITHPIDLEELHAINKTLRTKTLEWS